MVLPSARGVRLLDYIERQTGWRASLADVRKRSPFESWPISVRHNLLVSALWLLDDWPERFVRAATAAGLSQSRILRGELLPFWFESEIRLNLGAGFPAPTGEEARQAAAYLVKDGKKISGCAVGRLIGSRNSAAARGYAKDKPVAMTDADFEHVIDKLSVEIKGLRPRSPKRLILQRDRTIYRLMRATGWSVKKLLGMTVGDAAGLASTPKGEREYSGEVAGLLLTYLRDTRRHLASECRSDALFIQWRGGVLCGKVWSCRSQKCKKPPKPGSHANGRSHRT